MAEVSVYNEKGTVLRTMALNAAVFDLPANDVLLKEVYVALSANLRGVYAHTKTRGDRHGSGRKPWKQKHTGRARAGSIRSPLWRKGGVTFGPRSDRNFSLKINKKVRRKAVALALSGKVRDHEIFVVESLEGSKGKTKAFAAVLSALGIPEKKSVLVGFSPKERDTERASRNIAGTLPTPIHTLNAKELLDHRYLVVSEATIRDLERRCLGVESDVLN